ncbi:hypothetical protein ScPMuIL_012339 [Solemya velum]
MISGRQATRDNIVIVIARYITLVLIVASSNQYLIYSEQPTGQHTYPDLPPKKYIELLSEKKPTSVEIDNDEKKFYYEREYFLEKIWCLKDVFLELVGRSLNETTNFFRSKKDNIRKMLSVNARAFTVESLLEKKESDMDRIRQRLFQEGCMCMSLGDGPICRHDSFQSVYDGSRKQEICVELCHCDLWNAFHRLGTEMIITKTGRRMFPAVRVRISGLDPHCRYRIAMDFISVDKYKYRYVYHSSKWMVAGSGEPVIQGQTYHHPDSPMDGGYIASQVISFERIKLTNHPRPRAGQISLMSMQKFQPRIHIEKVEDAQSAVSERYVVSFPQTSFIAVTAYQNQEITRLKIARNPFAKGFRESNKHRTPLEAMLVSFGSQFGTQTETVSPGKRTRHSVDEDEEESPPCSPKGKVFKPIPTRLSPQKEDQSDQLSKDCHIFMFLTATVVLRMDSYWSPRQTLRPTHSLYYSAQTPYYQKMGIHHSWFRHKIIQNFGLSCNGLTHRI